MPPPINNTPQKRLERLMFMQSSFLISTNSIHFSQTAHPIQWEGFYLSDRTLIRFLCNDIPIRQPATSISLDDPGFPFRVSLAMRIVESELMPPIPGVRSIVSFENTETCAVTEICGLCDSGKALGPAFRSNTSAFGVDRRKISRNGNIEVHRFAQAKYSSGT